MTLPDKIEHCDECGWTGEVRETCPECELHERIRANAVEVWDHACELEETLRWALQFLPPSQSANKALRDWEVTKNHITNP